MEPFDAENGNACPKKIPQKEQDLEEETLPEMVPAFWKRKLGVEDLFQGEKYSNQPDYDVIEVNGK